MLKKMNLPNKLTMLRILLVPIFVVFMALPQEYIWPKYVALGLYIIAAATDFADGKISRKYNLITDFGKIMDPLADKLLISSAFIMLAGLGVIPAYIAVIIVFRDFFANSIRMFGADKNVVIAASLSGKIKTAAELIAVPFAILDSAISSNGGLFAFIDPSKALSLSVFSLAINIFMTVLILVAVIATLWSLVDYTLKFKKYIDVEK